MKLAIQLILLFILFNSNIQAQIGRGKITAAEYFFDTDPGVGLGTALTLQGGVNDALRNAIQTASVTLPAGLHKLSVRMKDSLNNWGPTFKTVFNVEQVISSGRPVQVSLARFYWDANIAGATNLIILNGNIVDPMNSFINSSPISSFGTAGMHKINIQVMDPSGQFGAVFTTAISIESANSFSRIISAALGRAYWESNTSTAVGLIILNGNAGNAINEFVTSTPLSSFANASLHKLNVQLLDPNGSGNYSPAFSTVISFEKNIDSIRTIRVDAARVWFDNNIAGAVSMLAFDGNFNEAIETAMQTINAPAAGLHTLNIQMRDSLPNHWGPVFKTTLVVETPLSYRNINVAGGQLYWDNDTINNPVNLIAFDGAFDQAIETALRDNVSTPAEGLHTLCVRFKDVAGNWGNTFRLSLVIDNPLLARNIRVTQGEVRVDNTPPITIVALNGAFTQALEQTQTAILGSGIAPGLHRLLTRMKGVDGNWGPYFITSLLVTPCATSPMPTVTSSSPLEFCHGDSTVLSANAGYSSYTWIRDNNIVGTGQNFVAKDSGNYVVVVTDVTNCPGSSQPKLVNVHKPIVTLSTSPVFCQGTTDSLIATPGFNSYAWSGGGSSTNIKYITSNGTYGVTVTDSYGCTSVTSIVMTALPAPLTPTISANGPLTFCYGSSVTLTSSATSNIVWNNGATSPSLYVDTSGSFFVTVTGANGCKSRSLTTTVHGQNSATATITASGPLTFCQGQSVMLSCYPGTSYTWSTGATTNSITVTSAGNYSVALVDSNGCSANSLIKTVVVNPVPPTPTINVSGPLSFCNGGSVTLTSSATSNNLWNNGATAQAQIIYVSGTFIDTVFNTYGCKSWSTPTIVDVHPVASISASGPTTFCAGDNVVLTASPTSGVSYAWSTGAITPSITVTSSQNISMIATEIGLGCKDTAFMNIVVNPLPIGAITAQGATTVCHGNTITLNATGAANTIFRWFKNGSPIVYYSWNIYCNCLLPYNVYGNSFGVTESGNYSAEIIDTLTGCINHTNSIATNVILPPVPTITANGGTTLCIGANTTLTCTPAVSYAWSTGASTQSIIASSQGTYSVVTTDVNGCTRASANTPVTFYPAAAIVPSGPTTFCFGGNVNLAAQPSGTYLWSTGSTNSSINNITTSGSYSLTVTDVNGCVSNATPVNIVVHPLPVGSITAIGSTTVCQGYSVPFTTTTPPNCIFRWFRNGSPIFYLSWNIYCNCYVPIYTYGYNYAATISGTYSAEVIDTLTGCTSMSNSFAVTVLNLPTPVINQTASVSCFGGSNAALLASASGTVSPYTYSWSNGTTTSANNNLSAATYTVQVTDNVGCTNTLSYTVNQPSLITPSAASPANTRGYNVTCFGSSDGSATVYPSGGTAPYTYLWSNGATTQTVNNLSAGTYTVTVFDANNCPPGTTTVTLTQPNAIGLTLTPSIFYGGKNISCYGGSNGSITVSPTGGTAFFTYAWSNGQFTSTAANLSAGSYSLVVTDSVGCTTNASYTMTQPLALSNTLSPSVFNGYNVSCFGTMDGAITSLPSGGTAPYTFSWADTAFTQNRSNIYAGAYKVTLTDTLGCTRVDSIILTQPNAIITSLTGSTLNCYGDSNGVATASASGGNGPFTYAWGNGATTSTVNGLKANYYLVTVTDARACTKVDQVQITQPSQVIAYAFGTYIGCGSQIGLLSVTGSGGVGPYTYLWSNGSTSSFQNNQPLGTYVATVTDSHGCWDTAQAIILSPPALTASASPNFHASCDSITTTPAGTLSVTASGGVTPYMYLWSNGATTSNINQLGTGLYTCIVTDANGCTVVPSASVFNNDPAIIFGDSNLCLGTTTTLSTIPSTSYIWSSASGVISTAPSINVGAGTYTLTTVNLNGCTNSHVVHVMAGQCNTVLNLKLFLQSYYLGFETMESVLLNQGVSFDATLTDTIKVQLRNSNPPFNVIASTKTILNIDGTSTCTFPPLNGAYYIEVVHRNALTTWSADSVTVGPIPTSYDFSSMQSQAYGNNMIEIQPTIWAFYSGDVNVDENLDLLDLGLVDADIANFEFGYVASDLNGDGNTDLLDSAAVEDNIGLFIFAAHP